MRLMQADKGVFNRLLSPGKTLCIKYPWKRNIHIVSNIHGKETLFSMWKELTKLFENSSDPRKFELNDKPSSMKKMSE